MEVLKIATAGNVDDGKSTLIGRILYDTKSLTTDKLEAIKKSSKQKGFDYLDFSLATDGLVAEREQGITIDVAHIYFSTKKRSYIIADTPGHQEYTRNMVTGASTSQVSIILIDARKGVTEQTKRHFYINNLLRVQDVIVAINKMDLVSFSEDKYNAIKEDLINLSKLSNNRQNLTFIPISALQGDNVVSKSKQTDWYKGETLLEHLEEIKVQDIYEESQTRFPVQTVIRPKSDKFHDFRGYAGKLYGGDIAVGDQVTVLPSQATSKVKGIHFFEDSYEKAERGNSIVLSLENDIDISRGAMIVKSSELPQVKSNIESTICWMDSNPLTPSSNYIIQHGVNSVLAKIEDIHHSDEDVVQSVEQETSILKLNQIGTVKMKLSKALFVDPYKENKSNGAFILIDSKTNTTAGVGFIH